MENKTPEIKPWAEQQFDGSITINDFFALINVFNQRIAVLEDRVDVNTKPEYSITQAMLDQTNQLIKEQAKKQAEEKTNEQE